MSMKHNTGQASEDFSQLEAYLLACLEPVSPRSAFERNLEHRIEKRKSIVEPDIDYLRFSLIAISGLLTSLMVIILGVRVTVWLVRQFGKR